MKRYVVVLSAVFVAFSSHISPNVTAQETVEQIANMNVARGNHTATRLPDGRVLIAGGFEVNTQGQITSAELYDPATRTFEATGSMNVARWGHSAVLLDDGRVLVAGGNISSFIAKTASAEIYDPESGSWTVTGSMTAPRAPKFGMKKLSDGRVVVTGGAFEGNFGQATPIIDIFDPISETFSQAGEMVHARNGQATCLLNDQILSIGGGFRCCNNPQNAITSTTAELFNPSTGQSTLVAAPTFVQLRAGAVQRSSNQCLIISDQGNAESYDPATDSFTPIFSDNEFSIQDRPVGIEMGDGDILVPGRGGIQIIDAGTGEIRELQDDTQFRRDTHRLTLLSDGSVLITGGFDFLNGSVATSSAVLVTPEPTTQPTPSNPVLAFCLSNPENCAFSINHLTQGWERHWNADRLQVTASTFKILTLLAYAEAVVDGRIDPNRVIDRDEWARAWVSRDGGALSAAWNRLGQPVDVSIDDIVGAMMRESDNAAPDWLLNELGERAFNTVIRRYIRQGYHDVPRSVNGMFLTWTGNPDEPGSGSRILNEYSGFEAVGYRGEVDAVSDGLFQSDLARAALDFRCEARPWETPPSPCTPGPNTSDPELVELTDRYFMRSTTRTYNQLMARLLTGQGIRPEVFEIMRPHIEFRLERQNFADAFLRHGAKGGSLGPNDLLNWTTYLEGRSTGDRAVVTIFMHRLPSGQFTADDLAILAEAILSDPNVGTEIQAFFPEDAATPELIPGINSFRLRRERLRVQAAVTNTGTAPANGPVEISLFRSDDNQLDNGDQLIARRTINRIRAGQTRRLSLAARLAGSVDGQFAILSVDSADAVDESVEDNNEAWQFIQ